MMIGDIGMYIITISIIIIGVVNYYIDGFENRE